MADWTVELRAVAPVRLRVLVQDADSAETARRQAEEFTRRDGAWKGANYDGTGAVQLRQVAEVRLATSVESKRGRRDG